MKQMVGSFAVLTARECAMLWQLANLDALRIAHRGDEPIYQLLAGIHKTALAWRVSPEGQNPADTADNDEPRSGTVTTGEIARELGVSARTVRRDIAGGVLPGSLAGRVWVVDRAAASTYITSRRKA